MITKKHLGVFSLFFFILIVPFICSTTPSFAPFENSKVYISLLVMSSVMIIHHVLNFKKPLQIQLTPWIFGLGLFMLSMTVSTILSKDTYLSLWGNDSLPTGSLMSLSVVFVFTAYVVQTKDVIDFDRTINWIIIAGVFVASYAILQHFLLDPITWWYYDEAHLRAFSTIGNPIQYGMFVGTISFLMLGRALMAKQKQTVLFWFCIWGSTILATLYSGSRGAVLLQTMGCLFVVAITALFFKKIKWGVKKILAVVIILASMHGIYFYENQKNAISERINPSTFSSGLKVRTILWETGFKAGFENPIWGFGPELFQYAYNKEKPSSHNLYQNWNHIATKAHNEIVQIWVTQGLVGIVCFLILLGLVSWQLIILVRKDGPLFFTQMHFFIAVALGYLLLNNILAFNLFPTLILSFFLPSLLFIHPNIPVRVFFFDIRRWGLSIASRTIIIIFLMSTIQFGYLIWLADLNFAEARHARGLNQLERSTALVLKSIELNPLRNIYYCLFAGNITKAKLLESRQRPSQDLIESFTKVNELCAKGSLSFNVWSEAGFDASNFGRLHPPSLEKAIHYFEKAEELSPSYPLVRLQKAIALFNSKRHDEAIKAVQEAIDLKPDFLEAYLVKIDFLYQMKRPSLVDESFKKIFAYDWTTSVYKHKFYYWDQMRLLTSKNDDPQNEVQLAIFVMEAKKKGIE